MINWSPEIIPVLLSGNYEDIAQHYENLIAVEPDTITHYWYLGLAYLLQEKETEAQTTWLLVLSQLEEIEPATLELGQILQAEAQRQYEQRNYPESWLIRVHFREIDPNCLENNARLLLLEMQRGEFKAILLNEWRIIEQASNLPSELLLDLVTQSWLFPSQESLDLLKVGLNYMPKDKLIDRVTSYGIAQTGNYKIAGFLAEILQIILNLLSKNLVLLDLLFWNYTISENHQKALNTAYIFYDLSESLALKILGNYKILYILMRQGSWLELEPTAERHKQLLNQLEKQPNFSLDPLTRSSWQGIASPLLYFQDNLAENRYYQNLVASILENNLKNTWAKVEPSRLNSQRLKIGYLASTLKRHSVGWLSRWLIYYHNRNNFEIILYIHQQTEDDITQQYFIPYADQVRYCSKNAQEIAVQIQADGIQILVDLDSITNATHCQVMALKPALIQVTWLGFDASGIPSIDYFIADNYVLPKNASDYYREKIWRLPNTYLAVKGFEVGIPTLRRENLDIPGDGIIYMTVQSSYKRHPDTLRLQMRILREVPNSYLLIKGFADQKILQELFIQIATAEGVNTQRLRFLPDVAREEIHRANLAIADVVLDTYPYNGATTTLEVLWMGIPLVTRVGEQFAARNSYTFMLNAGITEGIAWNEEEYLHWGIRFGREEDLRKRVQWQLKKSRQHAPLWDARKFTQEMEAAYTQMWEQLGDK